MSASSFVGLKLDSEWGEQARTFLAELAKGRYGLRWEKKFQIRVNGNPSEEAAPYAAFIPAGQPSSGPYGGMSFVLFPSPRAPSIVSLVVGTNGLAHGEHQPIPGPGEDHVEQPQSLVLL